jgi:hypothetical protein
MLSIRSDDDDNNNNNKNNNIKVKLSFRSEKVKYLLLIINDFGLVADHCLF